MNSSAIKRYVTIAVVLIITTCPFIPYKTVLIPKWRVGVVDENGKPYPGKLVRQFCKNYTWDIDPCIAAEDDTYRFTDAEGYVEFSEKSFSLSLAARAILAVKSYLLIFAHGSVGSDVSMDSTGPDGYKALEYKPGSGPPPAEMVLPSVYRSPI